MCFGNKNHLRGWGNVSAFICSLDKKSKKYRHIMGGGEAVDKEAHLLKRSFVIPA